MKRQLWTGLFLLGLAMLAGCSHNQTPTNPPPGGLTTTTGTGNTTPLNGKKFYWVQTPKGHPVHRITQVAFAEGCKKLGYTSEVIGTDTADIPGTIALAQSVLAKGDGAGFVIWASNAAYNPLIADIAKQHLPVIIPHFPVPEASMPPGTTGIISTDPAAYAKEVAMVMGKAINGKGTVALTQATFNNTENTVSDTFTKTMKANFPQVIVLPPQEEGLDAPAAVAKAVSIMQAHPDVVAALSTTGGGSATWSGAERQTGKKIIIISMDYTRQNLDLVKSGDVYAVVGQPLWDESYGAAGLLDQAIHGKKIPWWTKLPAPLITADKVGPYYAILDKVEAAIKGS